MLSYCAGIPIEKVSSDESEKLIKMEETLHTRVIGQEEAVVAISRAIRRARVGKLPFAGSVLYTAQQL